jgi:hypothetical protein
MFNLQNHSAGAGGLSESPSFASYRLSLGVRDRLGLASVLKSPVRSPVLHCTSIGSLVSDPPLTERAGGTTRILTPTSFSAL